MVPVKLDDLNESSSFFDSGLETESDGLGFDNMLTRLNEGDNS